MNEKLIEFLITCLPISSTATLVGEPRQGWAHKDGVMSLKSNCPTIDAESAVNRLLIHEAFARWGIAYDEAQFEVIRSLFTKGAELVVLLGSKEPINSAKGSDAIVDSVANALRQQQDQRRHAITNVVIDRLTENEASAIAYGIVIVANDGLSLGASVIYFGDLRCEADGVWRFSKFVIGMDHYAGQRIVNDN
jgi:hypothetical protein